MFETLSTLPGWAWILLIVVALIIWVIAFSEDEITLDANGIPLLEPETDMTDIITCSVPGQKQVVFNPTQYKYYSIDSYDWFVEVQLLNGDVCYIPSMYTTIIDQSFRSVSEKAAV